MRKGSFVRSLLYSLWAYLSMWGVCLWAQYQLPPGSTRTVLTLSPILPGVLIIAVTIWQFRASDEYIRTKILSAAATSAVITAVWTLAYGYLELVGLPRLSMGWVSNVGWFVFVALMLRLMFSREERTA